MTKKTHPADTANLALIAACKEFSAVILRANKQVKELRPTLAAARIEAARMNATATNGRKALVYAMPSSGAAILVPDSYAPGAPAAGAAKKAAAIRAEIKADRAPAKKAQPAKAKPAAKKAAPKKAAGKPRDGSKAETAIKLLTRKAGVTRKVLVEALDGWNIDLKQFCARKGLKMRKDAEGMIFATARAA